MPASTSHQSTLAGRLNRAQIVIHHALADGELAVMLAAYGYDAATVEQGKALYEQARTLQHAQERAYGVQYNATAAVNEAHRLAEESYRPLVQLARVALEGDRGAEEALGLKPTGKLTLTAWINAARKFYINALSNSDVLQKMARFNITEAQFVAGQSELDALEAARRIQERERSVAKNATRERDAAIDALDRWMDDFLAVAQVVLARQPKLREKLGLRGRA